MKVKSIFPILLVNFIGTLSYSIVLPFLVFLVTKFGGNALVYGILGAIYPSFQLIGAPILGKWSDIYGRKKILILSQSGTLLGWIIFFSSFFISQVVIFSFNFFSLGLLTITLPVLVLFIARAVDGLTGGNISVANAYLADITDEKDRIKNFGKMSVSSNLGFILGPALAGILGGTPFGEMLPVIAAVLISLFAVIITSLLLSECSPSEYSENPQYSGIKKIFGIQNKSCFIPRSREKNSLSEILKIKYIPLFLFLNFLIFLGFNFFYTAFPVHVVQNLGWSISEMGIFFSVLSLVMVIVQGPVLSYISKKFPDKFLILSGSLILAVNFILLLSGSLIVIYTAAVLFAIGNGLMWPSFLSLLSKTTGKDLQGTVQGYAGSASSLASISGLIFGGILYESIGVLTFIAAASVILFVFLFSFLLPSSVSAEN